MNPFYLFTNQNSWPGVFQKSSQLSKPDTQAQIMLLKYLNAKGNNQLKTQNSFLWDKGLEAGFLSYLW